MSATSVGLLAHSRDSCTDTGHPEVEDDWVSLISPHLTQEEHEKLSSAESDTSWKRMIQTQIVREETQTFLALAFQKYNTARNGSKSSLGLQPHPPTLLLSIYSLIQSSFSQSKRRILSHDRFLVKLQGFTSDAVGLLSFLLS